MKNYKFTISGHTYEVDILEFEGDLAKIEVNGTPYMVEIHKQVKQVKTPTLVRPVLKEPQKNIEKNENKRYAIKAPLHGVIIELSVKEGDKVKKGQNLSFLLHGLPLSAQRGQVRTQPVAAVDWSRDSCPQSPELNSLIQA